MQTRIGVFLCNCGASIKNIDFSAIQRKVTRLPEVVFADISNDLCLDTGKERLISSIRNEQIEKVVIAACSPGLREQMFRQAVEKAGLNGNLLSMANIREQCSWAHEGDVTAKAMELVSMAVNRARLLHAVATKELPLVKQVLVIGGGFSGVSCAVALSRLGFPVTLVEQEAELTVKSAKLESFYGVDKSSIIAALTKAQNIEVFTSARVTEVVGRVGDFTVRISKGEDEIRRRYGAVVLATGYETQPVLDSHQNLERRQELLPSKNLVSQEMLWDMLRNPTLQQKPKRVAFILDFAAENSRLPTVATLKNALAARQKWGAETYIFCKNVKVDSEGIEALYRQARECGVVFLKCQSAPRVSAQNGRLTLEAGDVLLGDETVIECDVLVSEELVVPAKDTDRLSLLLGIRRDNNGFYQKENVHLYPVDSEKRGIFCVGECRGASDMGEVLANISDTVMRVYGLLYLGVMVVPSEKVRANPEKCVACLTCIRVCPHGAIELARRNGEKQVAQISDAACQACGVCAAICPAKAIEYEGYSDEQILAQIEAIGAQ